MSAGIFSTLMIFSSAVLGAILLAYAFKYQASVAIRFCFGLLLYGNGLAIVMRFTDSDTMRIIGLASALLNGPAIWWLVRTQITGEKGFLNPVHLVPALAALMILTVIDPDNRRHFLLINPLVFLTYMAFAAHMLWTYRPLLSERHAVTWLSGYVFLGTWYAGNVLFYYIQRAIDLVLVQPQTIALLQSLIELPLALALTWWAITRPEIYLDHSVDQSAANQPTDFDREVYEKLNALFCDTSIFQQDDLNLEMVADELAVTARELSNAVNRCSGSGFRTFLRSYRINYAKSQLADQKQTRRSILDIALESGFANKSTFNIAFKAQEGTTPRDYRAAISQS